MCVLVCNVHLFGWSCLTVTSRKVISFWCFSCVNLMDLLVRFMCVMNLSSSSSEKSHIMNVVDKLAIVYRLLAKILASRSPMNTLA